MKRLKNLIAVFLAATALLTPVAANLLLLGAGSAPGSSSASAAAAVTPDTISGLVLWLKSDTGVTVDGSTNVSQWNDQSATGANFTQATAAQRPALLTNQLNGYPGVSFDGTDDSLSVSSVLGIPNQSGRSLFMVAKTRSSGVRQIFFYQGASGGGTSYWNTGLGGNGFWSFLASDAGLTTSGSDTSYHDFTCVFSTMTTGTDVPTAQTFLVDGSATGIQSFSGNFASMATADVTVLGRYPSGTAFYANYILIELAVYNKPFSASDRTNLRNYATGKYAY